MRLRRILLNIALSTTLLATWAARAQTTATPAGIPDATAFGMYQHVFRHVVFLKNQADAKVAQGNTKTKLRQTYQIAANLTDAEAVLLESTSISCVATLNGILAQARLTAQAAPRTQSAPVSGAPSPAPQAALVALQSQRVAAVLACRDGLRRGFGNQRFALFESFLVTHSATTQNSLRPMQTGLQPTSEAAPGPVR